MKHYTNIQWSDICGIIDNPDARGICSCGWKTGWDNGWNTVTRVRVWWHRRQHS